MARQMEAAAAAPAAASANVINVEQETASLLRSRQPQRVGSFSVRSSSPVVNKCALGTLLIVLILMGWTTLILWVLPREQPIAEVTITSSLPRIDKRLKFRRDGTFTIAQFADLHYADGAASDCKDMAPEWMQYPCSDINSTTFMTEVLAMEFPDLAVLTGDNIFGSDATNPAASMRALRKPLEDRKVPYMSMFGNHDEEGTLTRAQMMDVDKTSSLSLSQLGPRDIHGVGNYAYTISNHAGQASFVIFVFDSGAYDKTGRVGGYDWVHADQIQWFNRTSTALLDKYGSHLPAVVFMHIPLQEFAVAWECCSKPADDLRCWGAVPNPVRQRCTGVNQEGVQGAMVNSGLFTSMVERGNVLMVASGHDHTNDYCATLQGIRLCYAGGFGYHGYGKAGWPRRARLIRLMENGRIQTWKRTDRYSQPPHAAIDIETL
eukprot:jgi/Chlat1/2476/Chrsp175S02355